MKYIKAGQECTKCKGQAFWKWELKYTIQYSFPYKLEKVLKCIQCSNVMAYVKKGKVINV